MSIVDNSEKLAKKELIQRIKSVCGKVNSMWNEVGKVAHEAITHYLKHGYDASAVGLMGNQLLMAGNESYFKAYKKACRECAAISFREDLNNEGAVIAYKDDKYFKVLEGSGKGIENLQLLFDQGLRVFTKPISVKAKVPKGTKGMTEVFADGLEKGINTLMADEKTKELAKTYQKRLNALYSELKLDLESYGHLNVASMMVSSESRVLRSEVAESKKDSIEEYNTGGLEKVAVA